MSDVIPSLKKTLFDPTISISTELLEIGIDSLIENPVMKSLPVINTLCALCKVGYNLHERNLIKQLLSFISSYNDGTISSDDVEKHRLMLEESPIKAEKELSRILLILENQIETDQSEVLGNFYRAYVKGEISWDQFFELSEANRRMFVSDYKILHSLSSNDRLKLGSRDLYQSDRLISVGLVQRVWSAGLSFGSEKDSERESFILLSPLGKLFCQYDSQQF